MISPSKSATSFKKRWSHMVGRGSESSPQIPGRRRTDGALESSSQTNNNRENTSQFSTSPSKQRKDLLLNSADDETKSPSSNIFKETLTPRSCSPIDENDPLSDFSPVYHRWSSLHRVFDTLYCKKEERIRNPIGLLEVDIIEGFGLPASDLWVSSDPYCIATLTGYWSHGQEWPLSMRSYVKTSIINQTLYPKWNASAKFYVPRSGAVLRLEVFDHDQATADDHLGFVEIPLEALLSGKRIEPWIRLKLAPEFSKELKKIQSTKERNREDDFHLDVKEESHKSNSWSKARRMGEHACVHLSLRFDFAPLGVALTEALWFEDDFIEVPTKFTLERTLTEVFKVLRLLNPIIEFFTSDDETGVLDLFHWCKTYRSLGWFLGFFFLLKYYPWLVWSFIQAYFVYLSYSSYRSRIMSLVKYRASLAVHKKFGGTDEVLLNDLRYYSLDAKDFKSNQKEIGNDHDDDDDNDDGNHNPAPLLSPLTKRRGSSNFENNQSDENATISPMVKRTSSGHELDFNSFSQDVLKDTSQPRRLNTGYKSSSFHGTHNEKDASSSSSSSSSRKHFKDKNSPRIAPTIIAGVPPSPSIEDISHLMKANKPLAPLYQDIEKAMWNPKLPAFMGRPPELTNGETMYDSCVAVNYDSDYENATNYAWRPEDDYIDCKFELGVTTRRLLDELINLIRADWMDTTENLIIKINGILDNLTKLLDWREPQKSLNFAIILTISSILHMFISFHYFLIVLHIFLFLYFTPLYQYLMCFLLFPIIFPMRYYGIYKLMNEPSTITTKSMKKNSTSSIRKHSSVLSPSSSSSFDSPSSSSSSSSSTSRKGMLSSIFPLSRSSSKHYKESNDLSQMNENNKNERIHNDDNDDQEQDEDEEEETEVVKVTQNIHPLLKPLLVPHSHLNEIKLRERKYKSKRITGIYNPFR